jgi:hypothetical protein
VELANSRGAPDNVSVAVISIVRRHAWWKEQLRKWTPLLVALAVSAGLLASITLVTGTARTAPESDEGAVPTPTTVLTATPTPQVQPTEAAVSLTGHIVDEANLRSTPQVANDRNVRALLHKGQEVVIVDAQVIGEVPTGRSSDLWYAVQLPDSRNTGFVYSEFVSFDKAPHQS